MSEFVSILFGDTERIRAVSEGAPVTDERNGILWPSIRPLTPPRPLSGLPCRSTMTSYVRLILTKKITVANDHDGLTNCTDNATRAARHRRPFCLFIRPRVCLRRWRIHVSRRRSVTEQNGTVIGPLADAITFERELRQHHDVEGEPERIRRPGTSRSSSAIAPETSSQRRQADESAPASQAISAQHQHRGNNSSRPVERRGQASLTVAHRRARSASADRIQRRRASVLTGDWQEDRNRWSTSASAASTWALVYDRFSACCHLQSLTWRHQPSSSPKIFTTVAAAWHCSNAAIAEGVGV